MGFFATVSGAGPASTGNPNDTYEMLGFGATGPKTAVSAAGSTHTKGSYIAIGTTTNDWSGFYLDINNSGSSGARYVVDLRANGTTVIVPDLFVDGIAANSRIYIPLHVASGTSLDIRCQSGTASAQMRVAIKGVIATSTAKPGFTTMALLTTPDNAATKASTTVIAQATSIIYTQLIASTATTYGAIMVGGGVGTGNPATAQDTTLIVATGAAASEVEISREPMATLAAATFISRCCFLIEKTINSGTRVSAAILAATADCSPAIQLYGFS